jgi:tripeptide aminopeptidase
MIDETRLLETFLDLVRISSPSQQEQAMAERVSVLLRALGATVERDQMGNLLGCLAGQGEPLLLNAHLDTVVPCDNVTPVVTDGVITSDGRTVLGGDDKAGIAIVLEVIRAAQEARQPLPPLDILFTVQEEIGLRGARGFDTRKLRARQGIGLDAGGATGTIVVSAPSQDILEVVVHGTAAHAGAEPEKGVSAILVAAEAIAAMPLGRIDAETTANIGTINGGRATNIVADRVDIRGEARSRDAGKLTRQVQAMVRAFEDAAVRRGATVDIEVSHEYSAFTLGPDSPLLKLLAAGAAQLGITPLYVPTGGGSDSNILNAAGIEITNIAAGMDEVHTNHERIALADMLACARWLEACLRLRAGA